MQTPSQSQSQSQGPSQRQRQRRRLQVQELHEVLTCHLCGGYLVNPTTINHCMHSYCRSCIVQHLQTQSHCPRCAPAEGKDVSQANLRSDEALRRLVFKLVPGLYQQERDRLLQFSAKLQASASAGQEPSEPAAGELDEDFFLPAEPISLSLEYHPALLAACAPDEVPPVRYLQCPAGVTVGHLKRFLCSKYDIDPENRQVDIEIIYEDEVLPGDFTLMDVGYCYAWKRNGPMRFAYRILIHSETTRDLAEIQAGARTNLGSQAQPQQPPPPPRPRSQTTPHAQKTVRFADDDLTFSTKLDSALPPPMTYTVFKSRAQEHRLGALNNNNNNSSSNHNHSNHSNHSKANGVDKGAPGGAAEGPVKVIIARKPAAEGKKSSPKRAHGPHGAPEEASYMVANDFKSLRSNDLRYSDYTVTSTTSATPHGGASKAKQRAPKSPPRGEPKVPIVVSIPQSQLPRPPAAEDPVSLSQLKTANKKAPPSSGSSAPSTKSRNVPKLKIELGSLKTKITIPKPRSADVGPESGAEPEQKRPKHRKYSFEEGAAVAGAGPGVGVTADKVDLETYAKHIGLKPIEVLTGPEPEPGEGAADKDKDKDKGSPGASPMSSGSSTTSSSNGGAGSFAFSAEITSSSSSSSSHKKRKKKHSRDPRDSSGKRRKLHAEISSQPADESLKMKVKITAAHNHKQHRADSRRAAGDAAAKAQAAAPPALEPAPKAPEADPSPSISVGSNNNNNNNTIGLNMTSLNKALSEESSTINSLMMGQVSPEAAPAPPPPPPPAKPLDGFALAPMPMPSALPLPLPLPKPVASIKDVKIPSSPPLPPSLFKTTPLTLTTATPPAASVAAKAAPAPKAQKPIAIAPSSTKGHALGKSQSQGFAVPNPPRSLPGSPKVCATPASIASAANKHLGAQLKRSASLDDPLPAKHPARKPAYGARPYGGNGNGNGNGLAQREAPPQTSAASCSGSGSGSGRGAEKASFYSSMASAYTHEVAKRKLLPMNLPLSSISVSKINEAFPIYSAGGCGGGGRGAGQPALTITSHPKQTAAQQMINFLPYAPLNKPALEIVRITSSQVPADKQPLPPLSPPKTGRHQMPMPMPLPLPMPLPMQPPIPLLKIKKPGQQAAQHPAASPPPQTAASKAQSQSSPPALVNMRHAAPPGLAQKGAAPKEPKAAASSATSSPAEKPKSSLRDFRPSSKDGSVEILDLSAAKPQEAPKASPTSTGAPTTATPTPASAGAATTAPSPPSSSSSSSLEAALNKIKQNMTSCTVSDSLQSSKLQAAKASSDDLQNLHLLSESATSREKIQIKPPPKLYEVPKAPQPGVVRQQNASVRNIPNPSALAFRNQPALSMLASVASPPSAQLNPPSPSPSSSPSSAPAPSTTGAGSAEAKTLAPPSVFVGSPKSPGAAAAAATASNQVSPRAKKLTSIDQVAASLNIRAAAAEAEASAAKAASGEEPAQVSSTSTSTPSSTSSTTAAPTAPESKGRAAEPAAAAAAAPAASAGEATSTTAAISSTTTAAASESERAVGSSSSGSSCGATTTTTATATTAVPSAPSPTLPKTSFKSISSLVATTSAQPSAVASSV